MRYVGSTMLKSVNASSSCGPLRRVCTTAARSATHEAPHTERSTRSWRELDASEIRLAEVRHDRVEDEPLHPFGMRERVPLSDV